VSSAYEELLGATLERWRPHPVSRSRGRSSGSLCARFAIDLLRECSITGAVQPLHMRWAEGWGLKARARGLEERKFPGPLG
jgi:hypothetical protein